MGSEIQTLGVVGLGAMGKGMSRNVAHKHGGETLVFDLNSDAVLAVAVDGARAAAEAGTLSILVGADTMLYARIEPLLRYMGSDVNRCGGVGCGQVVKLINNALLFVHVAALAEMMVAGERAGVANRTLLDVLAFSSADNFALRNHGMKAKLPRDFPEQAFPAPYTLKDLNYALELAESVGVNPKLPRIAESYYQAAVDAGIGEKYFPAIIDLIEKQ